MWIPRTVFKTTVRIFYCGLEMREVHVVELFSTEIAGNRVVFPACKSGSDSMPPIRQPKSSKPMIAFGRKGRVAT